jgi:nucleoside-diphosphate-sugar epimerase
MENETIGIFGDGEQEKDLFFIDDLVDVLLKLGIEPSAKGEIFNVGSGKGYTVKEVAEKVIQTVGSGSLRFEGFPEKYKLSGKMSYISDIEKVRDVTGWSPKVGLEEGLKRTVDFYKENKEHYW